MSPSANPPRRSRIALGYLLGLLLLGAAFLISPPLGQALFGFTLAIWSYLKLAPAARSEDE